MPLGSRQRMLAPAGSRARAAILLLLGLLLLGSASAFVGTLSAPARAAACDQAGTMIGADWTVTTTQVCSGLLYTVDGSVTVEAGGSLTLVNGGLSFAKDGAHTDWNLTVKAGGALVLDNSTITVQPVAINPYLKLALNVSGAGSRFVMENGSVLRFPGWFNATDATIRIQDSTITGLPDAVVKPTGLWVDDNNDSAVISWASTSATLYHARIERIYENWTAAGDIALGRPVTGIIEANLSLTAGSTLAAYDTYIAADYSNLTGLHNELQLDGTSVAYLYNVTTDRSQDPAVETSWQPPFVPQPGARIDLLRWLHVRVVDATGWPVRGASVWSTASPNGTTAAYPDNGFSATPSAATLAYLARTSSGATAWNVTDAAGVARIPLFTDEITSASLPNANSFGNYRYVATYNGSSASGQVAFNPYPADAAADNDVAVRIVLAAVYIRTPADLALHATDYASPLDETQDAPFTINATIYNQGQTDATGVSIAAYLDGNRSVQLARVDGLAVSLVTNTTLDIPGIASLGDHTILLVVDPDNAIYEGGTAQKANNFANVSVAITAPPGGLVAIVSPAEGQSLAPGSLLSVTGYVRDSNAIGIEGVPLRIELRSGSVVLASTPAASSTNGLFVATLTVPANATDGAYTIVATPTSGAIQSGTRSVTIQTPRAFLNTDVPILGIPWWLLLILLAVVAAIVVGVTVYLKVYGLGRMVECGECGAYIHADAARCPRCGVEFEKDLAKCSNCGAWIPVEVKECPECHTQFATGELNAEDYEAQMRLQYEEIVEKLHAQAQRTLRRALTDAEFQAWWRTQPTFVSFDDWRREEEDVRRKGSKPCPSCGTLNSLAAKVCHTCGTPLKGQLPRNHGQPEPESARKRVAPAGPEGRSMISPSTGPEETETPPPKKGSNGKGGP